MYFVLLNFKNLKNVKTTQHSMLEDRHNNRNGVLISTPLQTHTQLGTMNTYIANLHNK